MELCLALCVVWPYAMVFSQGKTLLWIVFQSASFLGDSTRVAYFRLRICRCIGNYNYVVIVSIGILRCLL